MKGDSRGIIIRLATMKDLDVLVDQRHRMFEDIRHRTPAEHTASDAAYRKWMIAMIEEETVHRILGSEREWRASGWRLYLAKRDTAVSWLRSQVAYTLPVVDVHQAQI